jgi:hypothetical protein
LTLTLTLTSQSTSQPTRRPSARQRPREGKPFRDFTDLWKKYHEDSGRDKIFDDFVTENRPKRRPLLPRHPWQTTWPRNHHFLRTLLLLVPAIKSTNLKPVISDPWLVALLRPCTRFRRNRRRSQWILITLKFYRLSQNKSICKTDGIVLKSKMKLTRSLLLGGPRPVLLARISNM